MPWWDEKMYPFMSAWPEVLQAEADRYRAAGDRNASYLMRIAASVPVVLRRSLHLHLIFHQCNLFG